MQHAHITTTHCIAQAGNRDPQNHPQNHTKTTLTENTHTHRYPTHKQSTHPSGTAGRDRSPHKHTWGLTHTLQRAATPALPWTDTTTPCRPQHKLGARHTHAHTQARHLQIHNPAHARSHGGPRRPPPLSQPPHPAAATCARPACQASAGPITGCCWGAAPARRSRRLHGPRAAPVTAPSGRAPGVWPPLPAVHPRPLPDCGGRGSRGLTSPGPHWPPGGAAEPAPHCL